MQQEQYFKAVPVSEKPKQEGWITVITKEGKQSPYLYTGTDMSFITLREQYTHYLEPIQLPDTSVLRDKMQDILSLKHAVGFMDEDHKTYNQGYNHGLEMAQSIAREALSAGDGWVRIDSGNLPELGKLVWLGWDKYPDRKEVDPEPGRMIDGKPWLEEGVNVWVNNVNGWRHVFEPTHWKPYILPSPPIK